MISQDKIAYSCILSVTYNKDTSDIIIHIREYDSYKFE